MCIYKNHIMNARAYFMLWENNIHKRFSYKPRTNLFIQKLFLCVSGLIIFINKRWTTYFEIGLNHGNIFIHYTISPFKFQKRPEWITKDCRSLIVFFMNQTGIYHKTTTVKKKKLIYNSNTLLCVYVCSFTF